VAAGAGPARTEVAVRPSRPIAVVALAAALGPAEAGAQESSDKAALVAELIELTIDARTVDQMANLFLIQIRESFPELVEQVMSTEPGLSSEEEARLRRHLLDFDAFAAVFRAGFAQRVDLAGVLAEAYTPLYDASFTEAELREIVAFYRSPAGRKTLESMPILLQQGLERATSRVEPRVTALVGEALALRRAELSP
jgi:hypothetical protein